MTRRWYGLSGLGGFGFDRGNSEAITRFGSFVLMMGLALRTEWQGLQGGQLRGPVQAQSGRQGRRTAGQGKRGP